MKTFKFIAAFIVAITMASCSSIELTQSKYGNGIGISLQKNSAQENQKALDFRERKHNEVLDKRYPLGNPASKILTKAQYDNTIPALIEEEKPLFLVNARPTFITETSAKKQNFIKKQANRVINKQLNRGTKLAERVAKPSDTEQTQGDLTNLGYLGAVLVVAGLILMLLGVGRGWSVLALGVVLIIIAYFFG